MAYLGIFSKPTVPSKAHHSKESLAKNAATHLACSLSAVDENHGNLLDFEANLMGSVLHFNLETIAFEAHFRLKEAFQERGVCSTQSLPWCREP